MQSLKDFYQTVPEKKIVSSPPLNLYKTSSILTVQSAELTNNGSKFQRNGINICNVQLKAFHSDVALNCGHDHRIRYEFKVQSAAPSRKC